jgi:hypothetical protein
LTYTSIVHENITPDSPLSTKKHDRSNFLRAKKFF